MAEEAIGPFSAGRGGAHAAGHRHGGAGEAGSGPRGREPHPDLAYVFGDVVRAFYVVGCLTLDLFAPLQILDSLPGPPLWVVLALVLAFGLLAFLEYLLYRRLWPPRTRRQIVEE